MSVLKKIFGLKNLKITDNYISNEAVTKSPSRLPY